MSKMTVEIGEVAVVVKKCEDEINLCDSRIEAGQDVMGMCKEQMKVLKNKREFFAKVKHLFIQGRYFEASNLLNLKLSEP